MSSFKGFYQGRRVMVTGHTGFKGGWLSLWLKHLGAEVTGLALAPSTDPNFHETLDRGTFTREIICDVGDFQAVRPALEKSCPEIIFHLAGQALARRSYEQPLETFRTNVLGSAHILEAVRLAGAPCTVVMITSDKCYENMETPTPYAEGDRLGGHDVYSASKAAAELAIHSWRRSFFDRQDKIRVASARAGNVIGGGDYSTDRIIPDCVCALVNHEPISVRNPRSTRPWQHVLECLSGYLWLGALLATAKEPQSYSGPFNFGPEPTIPQTVREVVVNVLNHWPGSWLDATNPDAPHESALLSLSIEKARDILGWRPILDVAQSVEMTIKWYRERHVTGEADISGLSRRQIDHYTQAASKADLAWTGCSDPVPTKI